ncbi:unnamed protein product [Chilo suppressalis]|uniref:Uncharacterized protein n=1 Tax=Chilo suppressalis TaxID=168631 RepID=A0ABN8B049_CHISP|nr:unnamed protein product [Chilo suppressalis]
MKFLWAFVGLIAVASSAAVRQPLNAEQLDQLQHVMIAIQSPCIKPDTAASLGQLAQDVFGMGSFPVSVGPAIVNPPESISVGPAIVEPAPIIPTPVIVEDSAPIVPIVPTPVIVDESGPISPIAPTPVLVAEEPDFSPSSSAPLVQIILNINQASEAVVPPSLL